MVRVAVKYTGLRAPFPYVGGKLLATPLIWERFGVVDTYVEPFAGSAAVLLHNPRPARVEYAGDIDGLVCNFWRAVQRDPRGVAEAASALCHHIDLIAWRSELEQRAAALTDELERDAQWPDVELASRLAWLHSMEIGRVRRGGERTRQATTVQGVFATRELYATIRALTRRVQRVRWYCVSWDRLLAPAFATQWVGTVGIFLDPPYSPHVRTRGIYRREHTGTLARDVATWAIEHGDDPGLRIAVAGHRDEHAFPDAWERVVWTGDAGMRKHRDRHAECLWFSPHCRGGVQGQLQL